MKTPPARENAFRLATWLLFLGALGACDKAPPAPPPAPVVQRANPASENCIAKGGRRVAEKNPVGGEFSVCLFEDNKQCEEWALLRGHCPAGGIKVTGFTTPAARFCGITGGQYTVTASSNTPDEQGQCTLPDGKICDAQAHFSGSCSRP